MKLQEIKTIGSNLEKGAWVGNLPNLPGVAVLVRGTYNSDYSRRFAELRAGLTDEQAADQKVLEEIDAKLVLETVLLDWSGIDDMPYSKEAAQTLFADPELKVFRRAVNWAANVVAREGKESAEAALKN